MISDMNILSNGSRRTVKQISIAVDLIGIPENRRRPRDKDVEVLASSMAELGLQTPITVRYVKESGNRKVPILVAGGHRLSAAKKLGWTEVPCVVMKGDERNAEMWEIAENLHRKGLSKGQRDEQIRRYAELLEERRRQSGQTVQFESKREDGRGHRPRSIAKEISDEVGLSAKTVSRALANEKPSTNCDQSPSTKRTYGSARTSLKRAWNKASLDDRNWFLEWIRQEQHLEASDSVAQSRAGSQCI